MSNERQIPIFGGENASREVATLMGRVAEVGSLRDAIQLLHADGALTSVHFSVAHDEFDHDAVVEIAGPLWLCLSTT